jgi:hypothetical protein
VYFHDDRRRLVALPAAWTDVVEPDPFVVIGGGRCYFRLEDLLALADLVGEGRR